MVALTESHGVAPPRLEHLLETATDGVLALDLEGRALYLNASAERLLGHPRTELMGQPLWSRLPRLEETELGRACHRALTHGTPSTVEEYVAPLGAWVQARVSRAPQGVLVFLRDVTPLNQVEAEYASLHALVASAPAVAFVTRGPQHVFVLSNARHRQLQGGREVVGQSAREALRGTQGQGLLEVLERVYRTGTPLQTAQGPCEERLFHLTCQPLRDAAGQMDGVTVFAFDVTELVRARWRAERLAEELSLSEVRFRSLVMATSTLLWTTDATGCFREDSPTWSAFTGQDYPTGRQGSGWWDTIHPEDRDRATAAWKRALATRGLFEAEYRLRRADGTYTPVVSRGVPVLELDGSVREWVGSITDITAQRRARQALELLTEASSALSSTWELSAAMERLTQCLVPRLAEWCGVFLSHEEAGPLERVASSDVDPRRVLRLSQAGPGVALGQAIHAGMRRGRAASFSQLFEEGPSPDAATAELARAFAGLRGIAVPITFKGQHRGVLLLAAGEGYRPYDADDLQLAGELAHRAANVLEHVRLFELARQARDRAEEANRAKDEFLATVSHELRTPLTAILGWTSILRTTPLSVEKQARALETVERSARAQAQIVDDLLDISRIVAGRMRLELKPVDLGGVVDAVLDVVRPAAAARGIQLEPLLEPDVGFVQGDAQRLQQVAWNLLTNAIKFTPQGGRVSVRLRRVEACVELEVRDSGQGISPAFLPHLFERFQQADGSATRRHGGLGLGLSIVRHLMELQGGSVHAHSEGEGQGARFTVRIPSLQPGPCPVGIAPAGMTSRTEPLPDFTGVRVLVVDDEHDVRELLRTLLEERGARVTTASHGAEALERIRQAPPDLLVSDIGMPGEDGHELMRRVRALPPEQGGRTPAAALTAYTRCEDRSRALDSGFQVCMPKPVEPLRFFRALAGLLPPHS
jgi:PAS domain S-box-containing protein